LFSNWDLFAGTWAWMTPQDTITDLLIWAARTGAGFIAAFLLAFLGDVAARVFNLSVSYPWPLWVHQNLHFMSIGMAAGLGAFLGWMHLGRRWYLSMGAVLLVLAGGVGGAYLGRYYGPGVDPTYWWSRFSLDTTVHLAAAALSTGIASLLGLIDLLQTRALLRNRKRGIHSGEWPVNRPTRSQ
jgi:hypothetical protein